jgi:hypothetical protein
LRGFTGFTGPQGVNGQSFTGPTGPAPAVGSASLTFISGTLAALGDGWITNGSSTSGIWRNVGTFNNLQPGTYLINLRLGLATRTSTFTFTIYWGVFNTVASGVNGTAAINQCDTQLNATVSSNGWAFALFPTHTFILTVATTTSYNFNVLLQYSTNPAGSGGAAINHNAGQTNMTALKIA